MLTNLLNYLQQDKKNWNQFQDLFQEKKITSKTTLLNQGETAQYIYFVKKGCLRIWFNNEGKDITMQFFFENQAVASLESFLRRQPSSFSLESIGPATVIMLHKKDFDTLHNYYPDLRNDFQEILFQRAENYVALFLARIKDSPQKLYEDLLRNQPHIIQRVPQHYIASYLGITPISLSRIRNRK